MTDDESTTDKLAQDVVEGRHSEAWLLLTARERHDALLKRVRSPEWLAGATSTNMTLRRAAPDPYCCLGLGGEDCAKVQDARCEWVAPFEDDPHAPKSLTLGG